MPKVKRQRLPRVLKFVNKRTGKVVSYSRDKSRKAMKSGKRLSKNRNVYYEARRNRSDIGFI